MKIRKGGLRVYITERQTEHTPLCSPEGFDCGANAFSGIGYMSQANAKYLASITPYGLLGDEFLAMVNMAYPSARSHWVKIDTEQKLDNVLGVGEAIIGSLSWKEKHGFRAAGGHYFVIVKMPGDHPIVTEGFYVIDPQSGSYHRFEEYINEWKKERYNPMHHFYVLTSDRVGYANDEITREMIDRVLGTQPTESRGAEDRGRSERADRGRSDQRADRRSDQHAEDGRSDPRAEDRRSRSRSRRRPSERWPREGGKKSHKSKRYKIRKEP